MIQLHIEEYSWDVQQEMLRVFGITKLQRDFIVTFNAESNREHLNSYFNVAYVESIEVFEKLDLMFKKNHRNIVILTGQRDIPEGVYNMGNEDEAGLHVAHTYKNIEANVSFDTLESYDYRFIKGLLIGCKVSHSIYDKMFRIVVREGKIYTGDKSDIFICNAEDLDLIYLYYNISKYYNIPNLREYFEEGLCGPYFYYVEDLLLTEISDLRNLCDRRKSLVALLLNATREQLNIAPRKLHKMLNRQGVFLTQDEINNAIRR